MNGILNLYTEYDKSTAIIISKSSNNEAGIHYNDSSNNNDFGWSVGCGSGINVGDGFGFWHGTTKTVPFKFNVSALACILLNKGYGSVWPNGAENGTIFFLKA